MTLAVMDDFTFVAWMDTEQFGGVACILYCSRIAELNARGMFVNANQLEQHCFVYLWRNRIISSYMYIVSDRRSKTAQKCVHSFLVTQCVQIITFPTLFLQMFHKSCAGIKTLVMIFTNVKMFVIGGH